MKYDIMSAAMTGIDDKLITDAHNIRRKTSFKPVYSICALAACLVLVFTFVFSLSNRGGVKLLLDNSTITEKAVTVDVPLTAYARDIDRKFTVSLTLKTNESTKISISNGEMSVCSSGNTDTLYYHGTEYTTEIPVNIHWTVDGSDINSAYTLTLNDEVSYALTYDEATSLWSICKQ